MAPPGGGEGTPGEGRRGSGDLRRLLTGIVFMALLAGATLVASFLLGHPGPGADIAPGVPFLAASGAALVVAAAGVFYRTYRSR